MSFWSFWSRKPAGTTSAPIEPERRPSYTEADREFVRAALVQFESNGLAIGPDLDRGLICARALIDVDLWKQENHPDDLRPLFIALAGETDSLTWYVDEVEAQFPALASIDDDAAEEMLQQHSDSIFVNARSITTVNEDNSLEGMVYGLAALNSLDVSEVIQPQTTNCVTKVSFHVGGLGERHFELESGKYPDITPALAEMNNITKIKNLGQYIVVPQGSSEGEIFVFADEATLPRITNLLKLDAL